MSSLRPQNGGKVGYIPYDAALDDSTFNLCGAKEIPEYYGVSGGYRGGRKKLLSLLKQLKFPKSDVKPLSGYITIRFVVNCEGKTDRFRVLQVDENYHNSHFHPSLVDSILSFTKKLDDWLPATIDNQPYAYFQYLTFKIRNGIPVDILP
ncbi:hypothetical protein [Olivibacter sitiensis]|uniref:hypothetical protein n=1 Tax=Olivibacter sitiensis TaxID=376470 RepID=UPI0004000FF6|nr:hypothetical protein [Olivibacter sitiensis]